MFKNTMRLIVTAALLLICTSTFAENVRGFYLTAIADWLGDETKEKDILQYAKEKNFNYISLYDLESIDWKNQDQKNKLAGFMKKARTHYGITEYGAITENYQFIDDN